MEVEMARVALNASAINATLHESYWRVSVFQSVASTQTEIMAKQNLRHGDVCAAEHQSAGKGRLDRSFEAKESSALLFSLYLEPKREKIYWSSIPLLVGLSLVTALSDLDEKVNTTLKWPNDLLIGEKKAGGILVEVRGNGLIIGIGLNVEMDISDLPVAKATSLALEKYQELDRNKILPTILNNLANTMELWESGSSIPIESYRQICSTLDKEIEVQLPAGEFIQSRAIGVSEVGELLLANGSRINIGDVIHLR